jgi:hypothetical protein
MEGRANVILSGCFLLFVGQRHGANGQGQLAPVRPLPTIALTRGGLPRTRAPTFIGSGVRKTWMRSSPRRACEGSSQTSILICISITTW